MAPRLNKNLILDHFNINVEKETAICKICNHSLKKNRMFNLKTHLIKVHNIDIAESELQRGTSGGSEIVKPRFHKETVKIDMSKKQFFRSYIGLVTEESVAFNVLNSENMKNIIDPICRGLGEAYNKEFRLDSSNCEAVLKSVASNVRAEIKKELKQRLISLKIDNRFALSAQFISNKIIQSRILGMVELNGNASSSSSVLATEVINILTKYDATLKQIVSITSDNVASAIRTTGIPTHCSIFKEACEDADAEAEGANDVYLKNIEHFEYTSDIQLGNIQICRCAAHTAQLCVLDVTQDPDIKTFILNCRNLVKFVKKNSNGYRDLFEHNYFPLPQLDCPTMWGSTYEMVKNVHASKVILMDIASIKNESNDENLEINDDFWDFVESYCTVLEPLQKTIIRFQQEQLHYGNFYAQWLKCKIKTEKNISAVADRESFLYKIGKSLLHSIENRTTKLLTNESLNACLFLDPRFSHTLSPEKKCEAITFLKRLYDRLKLIGSINSAKTEATSSNADFLVKNESNDLEDEDECLNEYLSTSFEPSNDADIDVYTKIENLKLPFQRVDTNVLDFWKEREFSDPELYALSNVCFAIPSTQVTVEGAYSCLKLPLAENRNRLCPETLENILMVKLYPSFLDEAINVLPLFENIVD